MGNETELILVTAHVRIVYTLPFGFSLEFDQFHLVSYEWFYYLFSVIEADRTKMSSCDACDIAQLEEHFTKTLYTVDGIEQ